jgi:hypothetical protein
LYQPPGLPGFFKTTLLQPFGGGDLFQSLAVRQLLQRFDRLIGLQQVSSASGNLLGQFAAAVVYQADFNGEMPGVIPSGGQLVDIQLWALLTFFDLSHRGRTFRHELFPPLQEVGVLPQQHRQGLADPLALMLAIRQQVL